MHYYALIPLSSFFTIGYFEVYVSICFTGQVKSLNKLERQADQSITKINIHLSSK